MWLSLIHIYTPRWAHCDDNHAWVEVYVDGEWHFLGACEPEEELDRGWFVGPAGRAMLIHSRTFGDFAAGESDEMIGREGLMVYHNHTANYTKTRLRTIRVKDEAGNPAAGAKVWTGAVSYTHLDVYKRQAAERLEPAGIRDHFHLCL